MIRWLAIILMLLAVPGWADVGFRNLDDPEVALWKEEVVIPPAFPDEKNLREIYVSEGTSNRFYIDESTLAVGNDGVVRYVLVIRTGGGATNLTFEGIRCETLEFKTYASGRADGQWALVRRSEWRRIENKPMNRQHASLARDYFCPGRGMIRTPEEGRDALRRGRHPQAL